MRNAGKIMMAVAAALSLAACSNGQVASTYPPGDGPTFPAPNPANASASPSSSASEPGAGSHPCTADDVKVTGEFGSKPTVTIPDTCTAPTTLLTKDVKAGNGAAAKAGSQLQMNYDLVTWSDKKDLENSFDSQAFPMTLGQGDVIQGWDQGLVGIKQGGRRLLIVPPSLAYGSQPQNQLHDETLVFVVDAVAVTG